MSRILTAAVSMAIAAVGTTTLSWLFTDEGVVGV